ncbi:MAG: glycosyltransferase family 9 protein [Anderseniella sp.]|jgi:ADP-heptose:LPS heptosyltransferase|nr:glycosyltransferase family 9 protein [Anderseniella sp.]
MNRSTEKILVIKLGAFGDVVQADGALRDIRAFHPDADITLLTMPPFRKLMSRCPHINHVLTDPRAPMWKIGEWIRLARILHSERFTRAYDLQRQDRTALYHRLFLRNVSWSGKQKGERPQSGLDGLAFQLTNAGIPTLHCLKPDVSWMADDMSAFLRQEGVRKPYVALIPGCSARHPHKRWPYYAQLARALKERGYEVVTAPGPDEIELAKSIPGHTLLGPHGYLNWFELAGVLKDACYVVGNDTGPSHVASCLGKAGLALFGSHTSAARTGIRRGDFEALEVPDLTDLSVETVLDAITPKLPPFQENSV